MMGKAAGICDGAVAIVTGAGRGIGREEALELARQGARVVVNDLGVHVDGSGAQSGPAEEVAAEIRAMGGEAVVNTDDVSDWEGAQRLVNQAIETFGDLHALINNAGILRDRMLVNMLPEEWDAVIRVHLRGTFCPTRAAAGYWREKVKSGATVDARVVNTSSASGLFGNPGQTNYGAAKSGIATFTIVAAQELERYGVRVNAIAPGARTRMSGELFAHLIAPPEEGFDSMDPANVAPMVTWLASADSAGVTGRVFEVSGGKVTLAEGWTRGPSAVKDDRWEPNELGVVVRDLLSRAAPQASMYDM
jgi:NAD(P)-dependent dehydrogenase (short-subunit alcohol dehydrogenase family)